MNQKQWVQEDGRSVFEGIACESTAQSPKKENALRAELEIDMASYRNVQQRHHATPEHKHGRVAAETSNQLRASHKLQVYPTCPRPINCIISGCTTRSIPIAVPARAISMTLQPWHGHDLRLI